MSRMRAQRIHRALAAMDDIEHARRDAGLQREFGAAAWASCGSCSEGLSTKVLPHTIAIGNIHSGIIAGKLNGEIPAHTPMGCRMV